MPGEFVESKIKYYKMRREIYAKGGCGEIHIGVKECVFVELKIDPKTKTSVAIKRAYSQHRSMYGVSCTVIREIRILKELSMYHNPNIVRVVLFSLGNPTVNRYFSTRWRCVSC